MAKYPDLNDSNIIAVDIETYDPELKEMGTGVYRRDGNILGVAISNGELSEYYNLGHKGITQEEKENNLEYLKDTLKTDIPKLGTNLLYDLDWLINYQGIAVNGDLHDIQAAEPLLNEYSRSYSLNSLAKKYLGEEKIKTNLERKCERMDLKGDFRQYLYMFSYEEVKEYAIGDTTLPLRILDLQKKKLIEEELYNLYRMEMDLYPLLLQMRKTGVRINNKRVADGIGFLVQEIRTAETKLFETYGNFNTGSNKQIEKIFNSLGIEFERREPTEIMRSKGKIIGNPNFDKEALKKIDHEIVHSILKVREFKTLLNTFFINSFSHCNVNGRIHCNFNPLRSDEYGTVSGRLSSSSPNLQQIPSKDDVMIGGISSMEFCRRVFVPEENHLWAKLDWSQIEYRLIAHYAEGDKSEEIRMRYKKDPNTDYHEWIMGMTGLNRKRAKVLNFAMAYYMGVHSCSKKFGWTLEESEDFINHYHKSVPFVKITRANVVRAAKRRGFIKTILGRRARVSEEIKIKQKEHSMFNRLIQGSAADLMKKAMVDSYNAGVFNTLIPHLTVHDELDCSVPKSKEGLEALKELKHIMETCIKLKVPIVADLEISEDDWGHVKKVNSVEEIQL